MTPSSTFLVRRAVAALFVGWALLAIVLSLDAMRRPAHELCHPFTDTRVGDVAVVTDLAPSLVGQGIEPGDRVLEVNGEPYLEVVRRGMDWMHAGVPNTYLFERRDGSRFTRSLPPEPATWTAHPSTLVVHALLLIGAAIYLVTGAGVWWLKSD